LLFSKGSGEWERGREGERERRAEDKELTIGSRKVVR